VSDDGSRNRKGVRDRVMGRVRDGTKIFLVFNIRYIRYNIDIA
jgi:hypothetical protein